MPWTGAIVPACGSVCLYVCRGTYSFQEHVAFCDRGLPVVSWFLREDAALLRSSWECSKGKCTREELGELFFTQLCNVAPHVIHLFKRPKKIQAFQFVHAVDMLVQVRSRAQICLQAPTRTNRYSRCMLKHRWAVRAPSLVPGSSLLSCTCIGKEQSTSASGDWMFWV